MTVRRREPDRKSEEADVIAGKMFSTGAVCDDYLDAIEKWVVELRGAGGEGLLCAWRFQGV